MVAVLRSWLGFLALGAGLVHFALMIGSPLPVALGLLLIGAAEFVWGVFAIVRPAPPLALFARSAAVVPVIGWALLLVVAGADSLGPLTSTDRLLPMLIASLFDLLIAGGLTVLLRRAAARDGARAPAVPDAPPAPFGVLARDAPPTRPGRQLVGVIAGALVVAALTAPALAATEAAEYARPGTSGTSGFTTGHDH